MMEYHVSHLDKETVLKVRLNIQTFMRILKIKNIIIFTSFSSVKFRIGHLHIKKNTLKMILLNYSNMQLIL
jgi:hypothetical protein